MALVTEISEFEMLYTDITEIVYQWGQEKAQLMPMIDHTNKVVVDHAVSETVDTVLALRAWKRAKVTFERSGQRFDHTIAHHDQDVVYRGYGWSSQLMVTLKFRFHFRSMESKRMFLWRLLPEDAKRRIGFCFEKKKICDLSERPLINGSDTIIVPGAGKQTVDKTFERGRLSSPKR